jgi:hypothetical protein
MIDIYDSSYSMQNSTKVKIPKVPKELISVDQGASFSEGVGGLGKKYYALKSQTLKKSKRQMSNVGSRKGSIGVFSRQSSFTNQDILVQNTHLKEGTSDEEMYSPRGASTGMLSGKNRPSLFRQVTKRLQDSVLKRGPEDGSEFFSNPGIEEGKGC